LAILVHAIYNSILVFRIDIIGVGGSLLSALGFAAIAIYFVRKKIQSLDFKSG